MLGAVCSERAAMLWGREVVVSLGPSPSHPNVAPFDLSLSVLNAFKYPLLIGVGLSTVIGLLSCLIGYCSSHWCCKKEVQETRRERRRLMSMEMD